MIKRRFARTNKKKYTTQLATAERRERFMWRVEQCIINRATRVPQRRRRPRRRPHADSDEDEDTVIAPNTAKHYNIADTTKETENVLEWLHANRSDIALKVRCVSKFGNESNM